MERASREPRRDALVRKALVFVIVTLVVAVFGAVVGWFLGNVAIGALFGALIGFWGCLRSGYVMNEPNVIKSPF